MKNIFVAGLAGQGIVMFSRVLSETLLNSNMDVQCYDVIGVAHRYTPVYSYIRSPKKPGKIFSFLIPFGEADVVVGFEPLECLRLGGFYASKRGLVIINTHKVIPAQASVGKAAYPKIQDIVAFFESAGSDVTAFDATSVAKEAGHPAAMNMALLGSLVSTHALPISERDARSAMKQLVPQKTLDINLRSFRLGVNSYKKPKKRH